MAPWSDPLQRRSEMGALFDLYGALLTDSQREIVELYHGDDLSLSEIADMKGVTRQAVHDSLVRAEEALREFEKVLGLRAAKERRKRLAGEIREILDSSCGLCYVDAGRILDLLEQMT